jgi:hypothetical protein
LQILIEYFKIGCTLHTIYFLSHNSHKYSIKRC